MAAAIVGFAATLPEFDTSLGNALRADICRACFIGADAGSAIDLAAATIVHAAARSRRAYLGCASLADIGNAIVASGAGAVVVAAGEFAAATVVDGAAVERAAGLFRAGLTNVGNAK